MSVLKKHTSVTGLFWWWFEDNGNKMVTDSWWNAALYNHNTGQPYAAFYELKNFVGSAAGVGRVTVTPRDNRWYNLQGMCLDTKPQRRGLYITNAQKVFVK